MFCCTLLYGNSSFAIILRGKRELVALLSLSYWCLVIVYVALPRGAMGLSAVCDCHTHLPLSCTTTELFKLDNSSMKLFAVVIVLQNLGEL